MKKFFFASLIVLACAIGFFCGALYVSPSCPLKSNDKGVFSPKECPFKNKDMAEKPNKEFFAKKRKEFHKKLDEFLEVSIEQKKSLDSLRAFQDSVSTLIKKETRNAEKELRKVLEAETPDSPALSQAKKNLLDLQEKALNHRIQGKSGLSKILTAEQKVKMQEFHKNYRNKKFKREQEVKEPGSK
jgi:23S rRNA pseudoU1915 N3-methylase RlmH